MKTNVQRVTAFLLSFIIALGIIPSVNVLSADSEKSEGSVSENKALKYAEAKEFYGPTTAAEPSVKEDKNETNLKGKGNAVGNIIGLKEIDRGKALVQLYDSVNSFISYVSDTGTFNFTDISEGKYFLKIEAEGYKVPKPVPVIIESNKTLSCDLTVEFAEGADYFYNWKADDTYFGYEESAKVPTKKVVKFLNEDVYMADSNAAEKLYREYNIILSNEELLWSMDYTSRMAELISEIHDFPRYIKSKWILTPSEIDDDIQITYGQDANIIRINKNAFENAIPRKATVNGLKGTYFSNRLYHALIRYASKEGTDIWFIDNLLKHDYGCSVIVDDYEALTRGITDDSAASFEQFKPEELLAILEMYAEMPKGFHKVENLEYLIRRPDGHKHPLYPDAAAVSWPTVEHGYIEFMECAFTGSETEDTFRLVLHEKAHFLWANVFSEELKKEWAEIGGWYQTDKDSDKWTTSKETEFVTAYAHDHNPDEDMAESIAYYVIMPDKLESRSPAKYAFIRDYIMNGEIYMSQIREDLTFEVYNLYPDYNYPGKIVGVDVQVQGKPEEDKQLTVTVTLDTHGDKTFGAVEAFMRLKSEIDPVTGKSIFYDMRLNSVNEDCSVLSGTMIMSKYTWSGYWYNEQIELTDLNGNQRFCGVDNFGWKLYLDNPLEDRVDPQYVLGSLHVEQEKGEFEGRPATYIHVKFKASENIECEYVQCAIANTTHNSYSLEKGEWQEGTGGEFDIVFCFPEFMGSGEYLVSYISIRDKAQNQPMYNFNIDGSGNSPEKGTTFHFEGETPDYEPPELDVNNILVTAYPTHPEAPNGETVVYIDFYTRDNISGLNIANYRLLDPLGNSHFQWYYPEGRDDPFFLGDSTAWHHERICIILPEGSVPGKWGLLEICLTDKAGNFRNYNFLEIVHFVIDKENTPPSYEIESLAEEIKVKDKVQLKANNTNPEKEYIWNCENGTGKATVSKDGKLEAFSSGYVTVTMYEAGNPEKYGELKLFIASDAHNMGPWETETPASTTAPGVMIRKCSDQNCDYFEVKSTPVLIMTGIEISAVPAKTEYFKDIDGLDVAGGKLKLNYDNGTSEIIDITSDMVSGFDNTKVGKQTLTVTYKGKNTKYEIEVLQKSLTGIGVTKNPNKTIYLEKAEFDSAGMEITLYYNNGTTEVITSGWNVKYDFTAAGETTVSIEYNGMKTELKVNVIHKYKEVWSSDGTKHWHECEICGHRTDEENHVYDDEKDDTCNVCGHKRELRKKGDVNGDNKITAFDAMLLKKSVLGMGNFTDEQKAVADINGDGKITAFDAMMLKRQILGLVPKK